VLRLHFGQRGRSGLAEKLAKSASTDPQNRCSHTVNRWISAIISACVGACYRIATRSARALWVAAAALVAHRHSKPNAKKTYPQGWKAPKPYIRIVPQPKV